MIPLLTIISGVMSGVWFGLLIAQFRVRREGLLLVRYTSAPPPAGDHWPGVCVVVPACNEGLELRDCIDTILSQNYPDLSIMIAEDRSSDQTSAIADEIASSDARVHVVHITRLPDGWMGKSHALHSATRGLSADWLLFLDADCRLDPGAVRTAMAEAIQHESDLLTLWPRHRAGGFWEHMLIPLCGGIIALWFGGKSRNVETSKRRNRETDPRGRAVANGGDDSTRQMFFASSRLRGSDGFANGQFLLIRREGYERIGGHACVRDALIEDIPLAEAATAAGAACRVASGQNLFSVRMYSSYRGIRDGWARIYAGALRSPVKITLSMAWLLIGSLLPYLSLPALIVVIARHGPSFWPLAALATAAQHLMLQVTVSVRFWRMGGCPRRYLWLYPISVLLVCRILARAWWWLAVRGHVPWRDTHYRIDRRGRVLSSSLSVPRSARGTA